VSRRNAASISTSRRAPSGDSATAGSARWPYGSSSAIGLVALGDQRDAAGDHRGAEQVHDRRTVGHRREHVDEAIDVEHVAAVLELFHDRQTALLPHPEVDHPGDDAVGGRRPQPALDRALDPAALE
jgi:hypothetical protein